MHVRFISIVTFVILDDIIYYTDRKKLMAQTSPLGYLILVGPGLRSAFPLINRRVSINFVLCFLLIYL